MYEQLYEDNRRLLYYWVYRYRSACRMRACADADDLIQAGFLGLVQAQKTYNADCGKWGSWASFYIRNAMRETLELRGKKQHECISIDAPLGEDADGDTLRDLLTDENAPEIDTRIICAEVVEAVRKAVEAIPDSDARRAVNYVRLQGQTRKETAKRLHTTENRVTALVRKGEESIRKNSELKKALPDLDEMTRFHAHKGVTAFMRDMTSTVEAAVMWREEHAREYA